MKLLSIHVRRFGACFASLTALLCAVPVAHAASRSLTGALDPSDPNDVLRVPFTFAGGAFLAQSYGFGGSGAAPGGTNAAGSVIAAGGFDPYFSLFEGTGASATFLASNDDGPCPPANGTVACRDSQLDLTGLAAGSYTLAVSVFDNFSFAENQGSGTLGDGFIGLGNYFDEDLLAFTTSAYAVDLSANGLVITPTTPVPEPATWALLLAALGVGGLVVGRRHGGPARTGNRAVDPTGFAPASKGLSRAA